MIAGELTRGNHTCMIMNESPMSLQQLVNYHARILFEKLSWANEHYVGDFVEKNVS